MAERVGLLVVDRGMSRLSFVLPSLPTFKVANSRYSAAKLEIMPFSSRISLGPQGLCYGLRRPITGREIYARGRQVGSQKAGRVGSQASIGLG